VSILVRCVVSRLYPDIFHLARNVDEELFIVVTYKVSIRTGETIATSKEVTVFLK
jgi:hypothetical protein